MKWIINIGVLFLFVAGCSSKKPEKKPIVYPNNSSEVSTTNPKETSIVAKQVASEQGSNFVAEIKYPKGKSSLALNQMMELDKKLKAASEKGKIEEVQVVSWSDKKYPGPKKELSKDQKELAKSRSHVIKKYLSKRNEDLKFEEISMAEAPGKFAKFSAADEAKVKETINRKDAPGKVSESMVIFIISSDKI